jgi:hypothetical protein
VTYPRLQITADGVKARSAKVHLDGQDVSSALRGITLALDVDHVTTATLDLVGPLTDVDTPAVVVLPEETRKLLVQLGWTPPQG